MIAIAMHIALAMGLFVLLVWLASGSDDDGVYP